MLLNVTAGHVACHPIDVIKFRVEEYERTRPPTGAIPAEVFSCPKRGEVMPRKPKRPCRMTGCPNLTDRKSGYCEKHEKPMQRHYERFTRGYRQHERYGSVWRKIRDRHLAREPLCELCRAHGRFVAATLVHHIKPLGDGGTHDDENLMSLCVSCHEKIHRRSRGDG